MRHRYIVWEGHYRGRRFKEMHVVGQDNKPICAIWKSQGTEHEIICKGRPAGYALCRMCTRALPEFEQAEKLRTWRELAQDARP